MRGLTSPQKAVLVKCGHNSGKADKVPPVRGEALARKGYGTYSYGLRRFIANEAGMRYAATGEQLGE